MTEKLIRYVGQETRGRKAYAKPEAPDAGVIHGLMHGRWLMNTLDIARRFHVAEHEIWNTLVRTDYHK
jgi:hypothetical protein